MSSGPPRVDLPDNKTTKDSLAELQGGELPTYWLSAIIETAADAIISKTLDGIITSWNKGAERIFGYTAEEAVGKPVTMLIPADHPDEEPAILARLRRGERIEHYETVRVRKDGTLIDISLTVSPIRGPDGRIVGASKIARDITERKQAEEALRESEERFRTFFNSIDEGFCIVEMLLDENDKPIDYRFLDVNPSFEKQTGIQDALGKRMREIAPQHEEHWFEIYGKIALTGEPARFENPAAQLHRWYDVYAFRVGEPQERKVAILFKDITERKRMESDLQFQAQVLGQVNDAVIAIDDSQRITYLNQAAEQMYGLKNAPKLGRPIQEFYEYRWLRPEDEAEATEALARTGFWRGENVHIRRDGATLHVESVVSALKNDAGALTGMLAVIRDITARKQAEEALRESEVRFRAIVNQATAGIVMTDLTGKPLIVNNKFCDIVGYTQAELLQMKMQDITHPGDLELNLNLFKRLATDGTPYKIEKRYVRKDGSVVWADNSVTAVSDAWGKLQNAVEIVLDVTARKQAEIALSESRQELDAALAVAQVGIWRWNLDRDEAVFDETCLRLFGFQASAKDMDNPTFVEIVHPDDRAERAARSELSRREHTPFEFEFRIIRPNDKQVRWVYSKGDLMSGPSGEAVMVGATIDVTERKQAQEELQKERDKLEQRVAERTQELSATLSALRKEEESRIELMRRVVFAQEDERRRIARDMHDQLGQYFPALMLGLESLKGEAWNRKALMDRLLHLQDLSERIARDVHDISRDLRSAELEDFGIKTALTTYVESWSERHKIVVDFQSTGFDDEERLLSHLETMIYRIVQEALNNVIKHAQAQHVSIILSRASGHAIVIVEDDGKGFNPEAVMNAPVAERRFGLLGMQERVALVGATLEIESAPGAGTIIAVRIPITSREVL